MLRKGIGRAAAIAVASVVLGFGLSVSSAHADASYSMIARTTGFTVQPL